MKVADLEKELDDLEEANRDDELLQQMNDELDRIEREGTAKSSREQAQRHALKFKEFLTAQGFKDSIETCSESKLNGFLRLYYSKLRNCEGKYFAPITLAGIRAGIQRYLASAPVCRIIDIMNGNH